MAGRLRQDTIHDFVARRVTVDMTSVNWPLLRDQVQTLVEIAFAVDEEHSRVAEHLDGIINLLDYIRDEAARQGIPETEVFFTQEDNCSQCHSPLDDGEGWDGLCGNCADAKENA